MADVTISAGVAAKAPVVVGVTGASGALLAERLVDNLLELEYPLLITATGPGRRVWADELGEDLMAAIKRWQKRGAVTWYNVKDIGAPIASGSLPTLGMAVVPCSMNTLAAIAHGMAENLLERAADVTIKEWRPLVVVPRETPLSAIHLENMLRLARLGVRIVPPMPAFYLKPHTVAEAVDQLVPRLLVALDLPEGPTRLVPYEPEKAGS